MTRTFSIKGRRSKLGAARVLALSVAAFSVGLLGLLGLAAPASSDTAPAQGVPPTVSAEALPTVQINGVVYAQVMIGNTVYATGGFTTARPAGAAPGVNEVTRNNLLAYDVTTGEL